MPAIEFTRLRTKIKLLERTYNSPQQFVKDLTEFYSSYSDLTFGVRTADSLSPASQSYRTPVVINRELEHAFQPLAISDPDTTLKIIDLLWNNDYLEPRQLAVALLGSLPITCANQVLERIERWSSGKEKTDLISILHIRGTETLRHQDPKRWIETLTKWSQSPDQNLQKMAVLGLLPLIEDEDFTNLPLIYDFLLPLIIDPNSHLIYSLSTILQKLITRSEMEIVYLLKVALRTSSDPATPRFVRRCLPQFSIPAQNSLKTFLRENTYSS